MGEGHEACGLASLQACVGGRVGGARQSMWRSITWGRREEEGVTGEGMEKEMVACADRLHEPH